MVKIVDQDKKFESQLGLLRDEIRKKDWDLFMTLNFHRHFSIEQGHKMISQWDQRVSRELNGRHFHKPQSQSKRMEFIGCLSYGEGRRGTGSVK
jgi:hypothetical protein